TSRPPSTPPRPWSSSTAILARRTMGWPAPASPGGESGVSTPILIGFCADTGPASPAATSVSITKQIHSRRFIVTSPKLMSDPLFERGLVDVHPETGAVEGENRAVGVLHGLPHDVAPEQQRAEQLAAPRDGCRRERDLQVRGGAERGLDHAADIAAEPRRLRDAC